MNESKSKMHILLTSVGVSGPKQTRYTQGNAEVSSHFSAFGLWQLLPAKQRPNAIWFLLTPQARNTAWHAIEDEANKLSVPIHSIDLTGDTDDTRDFLEQTAREIPKGCRLTLNVTEGLRHHAFLFYALALYLAAFRDVRIEGVWYCRLETDNRDDPKPLIDLKPVLDLAHWFHALAVFRETGSLNQVSRRMDIGDIQQLVERLSQLFLNGMPLEAGDAAARLVEYARDHRLLPNLPLADELQKLIIKEVEPLAGPKFEVHPNKSEPSKSTIPLTGDELLRQSRFIERYFQNGQLNLAFGLLREWIVNWIALKRGTSSDWLDRKRRQEMEHNLGGLGEVFRSKRGSDKRTYKHASVRNILGVNQRQWAQRWNTICDLRNALQHHGMKAAIFQPERNDIRQAEQDWQSRDQWDVPPPLGGGRGRLLICPIGLTPGVLYSALCHVRPDRALVICSDQSGASIEEAAARAELPVKVQRLTMSDPFSGVGEFSSLVDQASPWLFEADAIRANLTGGTALMGALISQLTARASREYQRPVRQLVLIDRRTPEAQRTDPWQLGEIHYLDGQQPDANDESGCSPDNNLQNQSREPELSDAQDQEKAP